MSFSQSVRARSSSPISQSAETSQKEQMVKEPSSPASPSSVSSHAVAQHEPVLGQLVSDGKDGGDDTWVVGGQEAH